jgi:hypothetical protein
MAGESRSYVLFTRESRISSKLKCVSITYFSSFNKENKLRVFKTNSANTF